MVMVYKIINDLVDLKFSDFFQFDSSRFPNRGSNSLKLKPTEQYQLDCRRNFFSCRVIRVWNSLSERVVTAPNINSFKVQLETADLQKFCRIYFPPKLSD